jgi:hypothetical protein
VSAVQSALHVDTLDEDQVVLVLTPRGGFWSRLRWAWAILLGGVPDVHRVELPRGSVESLVAGLIPWLEAGEPEVEMVETIDTGEKEPQTE